ncbi:hypothetical protein KNV09_gp058 [Vibrio phage Athena]|uniref:Uncharacterized protein n=2 Tax=Thalassavirus TaxID=2948922 RepID=A0A6M9Z2M8_9CAUD|nr:hypothetical protein KNV07_gp058 [Vibrio phage Cody]YP_010108683.1 hypothetical protein KNV09_gp058 [Vibrio phage Athena]QKN85108.1 hypothetical protein CODY_58 [Vibrio phage Cody]QKN85702.1 hypothetical protein ATHENA_58 [Vibrio phage Athena]WBU76296.1 hypothetical protein WYMAN_57 [Vibrio phage Wyman]
MGIRLWDKLMLGSGSKMPRVEPTLTGAAAMRPVPIKDAAYSRRCMKASAAIYVEEVGAREKIAEAESKFKNSVIIYKEDYSQACRLKTALRVLGYEAKTTISRSKNEVHVSW